MDKSDDDLFKLVRGRGDAANIRSLVFEMMQKRVRADQLSMIAHPLGFAMIRIAERPEESLRLHLWLRQERWSSDATFGIHDHVFAFESIVLHGELENLEFTIISPVDGGDHAIFEVEYAAGSSILRKTPTLCSVRLERALAVGEGNYYSVAAGTFHTTQVPLQESCCTLLATKVVLGTRPRVLGPRDAPDSIEVTRPELTSAQRERCILALSEALGGRRSTFLGQTSGEQRES